MSVDSEPVERCRICGCTELSACPGGCSWVEPRLCSNPECVAKDQERKRQAAAEMAEGYLYRECLAILSAFAKKRLHTLANRMVRSAVEHAERLLEMDEDVSGLITLTEHVDEWVHRIPQSPGELKAKRWLSAFRMPATLRDREYLDSRIVTCAYEGSRYRVIGASRLGDVWLTSDMSRMQGYEKRVDVTQCADWEVESAAERLAKDQEAANVR